MKEKVYVGIDIGTTNSKVLILGKNGKILDLIKIETPRTFINNVEYVNLFQLENLIDEVLKNLKNFYLIQGMSFSSFGESVVPVKGGSWLHEPLMWYEECTLDIMKEIEPLVIKYAPYKISGLKKSYTYSIYKILWMKKHLNFEEPDYWLPLSSYFAYKYTGKTIWDITQACRTLFFDVHKRKWIDELLDVLGLKEKLGQLAYTSTYVGKSNEGISIFLGGHDHFTGLYGISKILNTENIVYDSMGSASVIAALAYEKKNELHFEKPFIEPTGILGAAFEDNQYYLENSIKYYGKFLEWIMRFINITPNSVNFKKINEEIEKMEKIEEKIYFISGGDLVAGEQKSRLNILNASLNINHPEIVQSAYIYLCTMSKMIYDSLDRFISSDSIYIASGGNTLNETFMNYKATLLEKNIYIFSTPETTALGASIASVIGSNDKGTLSNVSESLNITKVEPIPKIKKPLLASFERISQLYEKVKINGITDILE
jgi:sugar (pentulose or hexulose) kinase